MPANPLHCLIREKIARGGPMPFRDFMELALYHREHGYYSSGRAAIGRKGDFFTSVSVGSLFGELLASQFLEMWQRLDCARDFHIVEQGAHRGDFARDVLAWAQSNAPDFFQSLRYVIIEPSASLRAQQSQTLGDFARDEKIAWRESLADIAPFCGVHFSNELLDAFPIHLVRYSGGEWRERHVTIVADASENENELSWIDLPIQNAELNKQLTSVFPPRIENYTTEINLEALAWIDQLAQKLKRGWVLAIDYGYPRPLFYSTERTSGTLACCANHRRGFDPFENIGERDITAHVEFTSIAERAELRGFKLAGFTDQHHFLIALAKHFFAKNAPSAKQARAFQTLTHPQFLGAVFKVLVLEKSLEDATKKNDAPRFTAPFSKASQSRLRGLEFASDARAALAMSAMGREKNGGISEETIDAG